MLSSHKFIACFTLDTYVLDFHIGMTKYQLALQGEIFQL